VVGFEAGFLKVLATQLPQESSAGSEDLPLQFGAGVGGSRAVRPAVELAPSQVASAGIGPRSARSRPAATKWPLPLAELQDPPDSSIRSPHSPAAASCLSHSPWGATSQSRRPGRSRPRGVSRFGGAFALSHRDRASGAAGVSRGPASKPGAPRGLLQPFERPEQSDHSCRSPAVAAGRNSGDRGIGPVGDHQNPPLPWSPSSLRSRLQPIGESACRRRQAALHCVHRAVPENAAGCPGRDAGGLHHT